MRGNCSRFIIFYFFGFNFQLFRSADKLITERQLYISYSHKDLSVLGIGRMAKGRTNLGYFSFFKVVHYPFFYSLTFTFTFSYISPKFLILLFHTFLRISCCAGIFEQSMESRNREEYGCRTGPPEPVFLNL
jgi:hypothetical protein